MSDELTPEQKFAAEDPAVTVPRDLKRGRDKAAIIADMVKLDWTPAAAADFVGQVEDELRRWRESPEARDELVREKVRLMAGGSVLVVLGAAFLLATLLIALSGHGAMIAVLPLGVVALGLALFYHGYTGWQRYRRDDSDG